MGKFSPDNYTRPQLLEALAKAGITGFSRARKDELAEMCNKLRGKARVAVEIALEASSPKGKNAVMPLEKPIPVAKKPAKRKATAPKPAAMPKGTKKKVEQPADTAFGRLEAEASEADASRIITATPQPAFHQAQPPPPGDYPLPEGYGIDMFHVLVFDPYGAYMFWELSPELLGQLSRNLIEEKWQARKLMVRAKTASGKLITQELYGDRGSYFMNVQQPGQVVSFELGFMLWDEFCSVSPVRAIAFPRDRASEDKSVKLLEVLQAEASLSLRELAGSEVHKLTLEPVGDDYRSDGEEGPLPSSAENMRPGGGE